MEPGKQCALIGAGACRYQLVSLLFCTESERAGERKHHTRRDQNPSRCAAEDYFQATGQADQVRYRKAGQQSQQLDRLLDDAEGFSSILQEGHQRLVAETINCYIAIYYYSALTNYWSQGYLPPPDQFDEQNISHVQARRAVDSSANDFFLLGGILKKATPEQLQASPVVGLLNEAQQTWLPFVRTSQQIFESPTV